MQFNSVQSGSFLTGAKSVTDAATEIYNTAQQTGFQVDTVIKQANANEALKKVAAARRNALMASTATKGVVEAKTEDIKTKRDKAIKDILRPAVRMEGVNRMAGSVAAGAYIMDEAKQAQKENAALKDYRTKMQKNQEEILQQGKESRAQQAAFIKQILKGSGVKFSDDGTPIINSSTTPSDQTNNSGTLQNISSSSTSMPVEIQGSGVLSPEQVKSLAKNSGFTDSESDIVVKIARGESTFNPKAHNDDASMGDNSYGLMQINMLGDMGPERRKLFGIQSNEQLKDPQTNMDAAFKIFQRQGFPAWTVYRDLKAKGEL
jgi:hypothetical protein